MGSLAPAAPLATPAAANSPLSALGAGGTTVEPNTMGIISNPGNQALLVYATPHEQDLLEAMLRKIDMQPLEIRIGATIAEVGLNDALQHGTQFLFKLGGIDGILNNASAALTNPVSAVLGTSVDTTVRTTTDGTNRPTFSERNVSSRVMLHPGQTVGFAGLVQDSVSRGKSGMPWLKAVPLIGLLAGTQNNTHTCTELLVLITPHMLHDARDAQALTEDLRKQMHNNAAFPYELQRVCATGLFDPNLTLRRKMHLEP